MRNLRSWLATREGVGRCLPVGGQRAGHSRDAWSSPGAVRPAEEDAPGGTGHPAWVAAMSPRSGLDAASAQSPSASRGSSTRCSPTEGPGRRARPEGGGRTTGVTRLDSGRQAAPAPHRGRRTRASWSSSTRGQELRPAGRRWRCPALVMGTRMRRTAGRGRLCRWRDRSARKLWRRRRTSAASGRAGVVVGCGGRCRGRPLSPGDRPLRFVPAQVPRTAARSRGWRR